MHCVHVHKTVKKLSTGSSTDYETLGVIFQFLECETKQCILVNIFNDGVDESEEFFNFTVTRILGLDPRINLDSTVGQVVIHEISGKSRTLYAFNYTSAKI